MTICFNKIKFTHPNAKKITNLYNFVKNGDDNIFEHLRPIPDELIKYMCPSSSDVFEITINKHESEEDVLLGKVITPNYIDTTPVKKQKSFKN